MTEIPWMLGSPGYPCCRCRRARYQRRRELCRQTFPLAVAREQKKACCGTRCLKVSDKLEVVDPILVLYRFLMQAKLPMSS
mmetsp:Transcript_39539/g.73717  ORF Transcript_39539/g.73717 Transcript_39539/m.73717 type:complete len:81 (+) Transcript_39539:1784-2026(+)